MKKRFSILLSVLLSISLLFPLTSCVGSKTVSVSDSSDTASDPVTPASDFEYKENEDGITVTKYIGDSKEVVIPETIDGKPVTVIGENFLGESPKGKEVTFVSMPDTVRVMEHDAFNLGFDLENVHLSSGLLTIERYAFATCYNLKNIHFPSGLLSIGDRAFWKCSGLADIVLPESLTEIGYGAFEGCAALKEINIPKNVVEVGSYAFYECPLERIIFAEDGRLEEIGAAAFAKTMVTEITFPSSLRKVWDQAFAACTSLNKVTLNDGLQFIDNWVFAETAISELRIPASVEDIDFYVLTKHLNPVALYFEGDLPEDFFQLAALKPNDYTDMTFYLHEGARGFDIEGAELFTIKTW